MTLLEQALEYAKLGYRVFPVINKKPAFRKRGSYFYELATNAPCQITKWWTKKPNANIGIAPGPRLVVFDPDNHQALCFLARTMGLAPKALLASTRSVKTPGGGYHLYYSTPILYKNHTAKKILDERGRHLAIDIKTWGGFVVAPPSTSHKGQYQFINEQEPAPLPDALKELLRKTGLVKFGPDAVKPVKAPVQPVCWDVDEEAEREQENEEGNRVPSPTPEAGVDFELMLDKASQMEIMYPINKSRGLNRDAQQGKMVCHLISTNRRQGKAFIRAVGRRWLFNQQNRFEADLDSAYAHLERNIDDSLERRDPETGEYAISGPDEQDYIDWMMKQAVPENSLQMMQEAKRGIGCHRLLVALLRIVFWKLLNTEDDDIKFTNKQLAKMAGLSKTQLFRLKPLYVSWAPVLDKNGKLKLNRKGQPARSGNVASALKVLVETEMGHHDKTGKALPSRFLLDEDFERLAFPFADEDDGEREYETEDKEDDDEREETEQWLTATPKSGSPRSSRDETRTAKCCGSDQAPETLMGRPRDTATKPRLLTSAPTAGGATERKGRPKKRQPLRKPIQGRVRCCDGSKPLIWSRYERD